MTAATLTAESGIGNELGGNGSRQGDLWPGQGGEDALGPGSNSEAGVSGLVIAMLESGEGQKS